MTNKELAAELRKLADAYDGDPELLQLYQASSGQFDIYCHTAADFHRAVRAMQQAFGGRGAKEVEGGAFPGLNFRPDTLLPIRVFGFQRGVCQKVLVGCRVVPEQVIPAKPASPEEIIPEHTEDIVEWRCPEVWGVEEVA